MLLTLRHYVKKRNGVPMGHRDSLSNMLRRSLGAKSFAQFWLYWNPIWGYYLARYIQRPLSRYAPCQFALVVTFLVSGMLHDVAIILVKQSLYVVFTPWFGVMACVIILTEGMGLTYSRWPWIVRALINITLIGMSLLLVVWTGLSIG